MVWKESRISSPVLKFLSTHSHPTMMSCKSRRRMRILFILSSFHVDVVVVRYQTKICFPPIKTQGQFKVTISVKTFSAKVELCRLLHFGVFFPLGGVDMCLMHWPFKLQGFWGVVMSQQRVAIHHFRLKIPRLPSL